MGTRCSSELLPKLTCLGFLPKKQPGQVTPPSLCPLTPEKTKPGPSGSAGGPPGARAAVPASVCRALKLHSPGLGKRECAALDPGSSASSCPQPWA